MRNTLINELEHMAQSDDRLVLMTGDLGYNVLNSFADHYPSRYFNAGIAEDAMTAAAAGMALCGKIVFTYSIGNFNTLRCIEQLRNDVCYHNANVKVISVGSGFAYGQLGMSHHATEDIAMMRALPNMRVYVPCDPEEAVAALHAAIDIPGPCYIRLAKQGEPVLYQKPDNFHIHNLHKLRNGTDLILLGCGPILCEVLKAADMLKTAGILAGVYSVPSIKPLDNATIEELSRCTSFCFTVEEHQASGGLGGAVAELLSGLKGPHAELIRIGLNDTYTSIVGSHDYLCDQYGLSAHRIIQRVQEILG